MMKPLSKLNYINVTSNTLANSAWAIKNQPTKFRFSVFNTMFIRCLSKHFYDYIVTWYTTLVCRLVT